MSNTIDNRVVSLEFDNARFEKNVAESMSTLDKLKEKLHFKGAADGLAEIESASERVEMGGLAGAVETVKAKFSALEAVAVGALMNIGSKAVDAGVKLVKSLSLDQITAGFDKYAQKTSSVQTILNATKAQGENMESVTEQLERLNWFTDETSYSFTDMVANIGKFTNNGVLLDDAVEAMEGIATWAGISGATVQQASHAMYNLSQAMGVGFVQLIDWKSIENAQMATREFKQMAINAALAAGTIEDLGDGEYHALGSKKTFTIESFSKDLTEGQWLTRDVLTETLKNYSSVVGVIQDITDDVDIQTSALVRYAIQYRDGTLDMAEASAHTGLSAEELTEQLEKLSAEEYDLGLRAFKAAQESRTFADVINYTKDAVSSGWMNTFEKIFGNYEESVDLWSALSETMYEVFVESGDKRNEILQDWYDLGGRDDLIKGLWNIVNGLVGILRQFRGALEEVFPPVTGERLAELTRRFKDFTEKFKMTDETAEKVKNAFSGVISVFRILWEVIKPVGIVLKSVGGVLAQVANGLLGLSGGLGESITEFAKGLRDSEVLTKKAQEIAKWISGIPQAVADLFERITGIKAETAVAKVRKVLEGLTTAIKKFFTSLSSGKKGDGSILENNTSKLGKVLNWVVDVGGKAWSIIKAIIDKARELFTFIGGAIGESEAFKAFTGKLHEWGQAFINFDFSSLSNKTGTFAGIVDKAKGAFDKIKSFLGTVWEFIKGGASSAATGISKFFADLKGKIQNFDFQYIIIWAKKFKRFIDILIDIFKGIAIASLIWEVRNLTMALTGVVGSFKGIFDSAKNVVSEVQKFFKTITGKIEGKTALKGFQGVANGIKTIAEGIAIVVGAIVALAVAQNKMEDKDAMMQAVYIVAGIAVVLGILAGVLTLLARESNKINSKKGITKFHALKGNGMRDIALAILAMSTGIAIISFALTNLVKAMDSDVVAEHRLGKAVGAISAIFIEMTALAAGLAVLTSFLDSKFGGGKGTMTKVALMLLAMSVSILIISAAVRKIAELDNLSDVDKATNIMLKIVGIVSAIFGVAAIISAATKGMGALGIGVAGAALALAGLTLIEIAKAIQMIEGPLTRLGEQKQEVLVQGLVALGVILLELGVTSAIIGHFPTAVIGALGVIELVWAVKDIMDPLQTLFVLAQWDLTSLAWAIAGLGAVLAELSAATFIAALSPTAAIGGLGSLEIVKAVNGLCKPLAGIYGLVKYDWWAFELAVVGLGEIMALLVGASWLTGFVNPLSIVNAQTMKTLVEVVDEIIDPMKRISEIPWKKQLESIASMKLVFSALKSSLSWSGPGSIFKMAKAEAISKLASALKELPEALAQLGMLDTNAVTIAVENIKTALNGLKDVLKKDSFPSIDSWIDDLFSAKRADAIATLTESLPKLADAVKTMTDVDPGAVALAVWAIGEAFRGFGEAISTNVTLSVAGVSWSNKSKNAAEAIGELVENIDLLTASLPPFMDIMKKYGTTNVTTAMTAIGNGFKAFGTALGDSPWFGAKSRGEGIGALIANIEGLSNSLPSFMELLYGPSSITHNIHGVHGGHGGNLLDEYVPSGVAKVSEALTILGNAFRDFGTAIKESGLVGAINGQGIGDAILTLTLALDPMIAAVKKYQTLLSDYSSDEVLAVFTSFKNGMLELAKGLDAFAWTGNDKLADEDIAAVDGFTLVVNNLDELSNAIAKIAPVLSGASIAQIIAGLEKFGTALADFAADMKTLGEFEIDFDMIEQIAVAVAEEYVDSLIKGLSDSWNNVNLTLGILVWSAYSSVKNDYNYGLFRQAGKYLMQGLKNGILSESYSVSSTVRDVARNMKDAFTDETLMGSPSRLFAQYGRWIDQGLINGLEEYSSRVATASEAMADDAISAARKPFVGFNDDWTETMTITPVLDLSEIQNDRTRLANSLNGFGIGASVSLAEQTAANMARRQNNASKTDDGFKELTGLVRDLVDNPPSVNHNEFNITSDDPEEVADAVERRLTRDIERRNAVWRR